MQPPRQGSFAAAPPVGQEEDRRAGREQPDQRAPGGTEPEEDPQIRELCPCLDVLGLDQRTDVGEEVLRVLEEFVGIRGGPARARRGRLSAPP